MRFLVVFASVIFSMLLSFHSYSFGRSGHGLVCDMALQLVSVTTQQQLASLVAASPHTEFASACAWPDEVRGQDEFRWSAPHHYVNMPRGEKQVTIEDCPERGCILSAIADMQQRLAADKHDWQALLFLAHHIGDLHQPLHVSYADDLGGNRTAVYFYSHEMPTNLHGVWDTNMLSKLGYDDDYVKQEALFLQLTADNIANWQQGTVLDWANESAALTYDIYQQYRPGMLIDDTYVLQYQPILEQRLQQAAVRLAFLLEQLLTIENAE
ncbi:endonuclease [Alishewanella longhuensis]|uniref:Endonuclease n=1 Tax=Alishewanella longhuensis TaxID=1091037 RepID=A0ABQ3KZE3_9ALTE|nr:S1/P1 nuclease [Alishewanella longhuensis]GHG69729.1 endonuclease [Alishewanella longhuensis]